MYYTPAGCIPGKVAHITLEQARLSAKFENTYVMDDNFEIIKDEDYREQDTEDEQALRGN